MRMSWPSQGRPCAIQSFNTLFWCLFCAAAGLGWLGRLHIPMWSWLSHRSVGFVMLQGLLSQRRELERTRPRGTDHGDPEGKIAALGRLGAMSRMPVEGRGIDGLRS